MITALIISLAALLIAIALFNMSRQKAFMEAYLQEFNDTLSEASLVRQDLEDVMENTVRISGDLMQDMDKRIEHWEALHNTVSKEISQKASEDDIKEYEGFKLGIPDLKAEPLPDNSFFSKFNCNDIQKEQENQRDNEPNPFTLEAIKTAHPYLAVRTLYEQGYSIREIAQLLNRGQGEVELILNLSRKRNIS